MSEIIKSKECFVCKQFKYHNNFGKSKNTYDGLRRECKECRKIAYQNNIEYERAIKRLDYQLHKEQRQIKSKYYYRDNKERCLLKRKEHYNKNKKQVLQSQKIYRENNKEIVTQRKKQYNLRKKQEKLEKQRLFQESLITVKYPDNYKICGRCKSLKEISNFRPKTKGGFISHCKLCEKETNKIYRELNKEKLSQKDKIRRSTPENKQYQKERNKRYRSSERGIFKLKEYKSKPNVRIADACRTRVYEMIKLYNLKKEKRTFEYIGCEVDFLINYLESMFVEGMTWDNYGEWHIDHIKPCCSFDLTKQEEIYKCFNYSNLRPLWGKDNLSKANKDKELSIQ